MSSTKTTNNATFYLDDDSKTKLTELEKVMEKSKSAIVRDMIDFFYERKDRIKKGIQFAM
jgi:predicted transcriptional regulator